MVLVIVFLLIVPSAVWAQQDNYLSVSTDHLAEELGGLKAGSERLYAGNAVLAAQNNALKSQMLPAQTQLRKLEEENAALTRASLKLQDADPARARKIAELEKTAFDLDNKMDRLAEETKTDQSAIDGADKEDARLAKKLAELGLSMPAVAEPVEIFDSGPKDPAKEKLWLLKMIADSKQRQEELYGKIAFAQRKRPAGTAQPSSDKDALLNQIAVLQDQVNKLTKALPPPSVPVDPQRLVLLQEEVKSLQKNHDELENLVNRMQQKLKKFPLTPDQRSEQGHLRATLEELGKESRRLKGELNVLRKQMIDLDKRKTSLSQ